MLFNQQLQFLINLTRTKTKKIVFRFETDELTNQKSR